MSEIMSLHTSGKMSKHTDFVSACQERPAGLSNGAGIADARYLVVLVLRVLKSPKQITN